MSRSNSMPFRRRRSWGRSIASALKLVPMQVNNTFWCALFSQIPLGGLATVWLDGSASALPEDGLAAGYIQWATRCFAILFGGFGKRCGVGFRKLKGQEHDETFNISFNRNFGFRVSGLQRFFTRARLHFRRATSFCSGPFAAIWPVRRCQ